MKPTIPIFVAAQAVTPFLGKGRKDYQGADHRYFRADLEPGIEQFTAEALRILLQSRGWDETLWQQIQRIVVGNFAGELFCQQGMLGGLLSRIADGFRGTGAVRCEAACASGGVSVVSAIEALQAGLDLVLVVGVEVQTTVRAREGADFLARAAHYPTERSLDPFTFPALMAKRTKAYKEAYSITDADLSRVSLKAYANANLNPLAHRYHTLLSPQQAQETSDDNPHFLKNPQLHPHLKISDCSPVSDGAAAILLASPNGLKKLELSPKDCCQILSYAIATNPLGKVQSPLQMDTSAKAAQEALSHAKLTPRQIQAAELHDCFAIAEILAYEAVGWAKPGEAVQLLKNQYTSIQGPQPTNTGGGLIGFGHPVGATGVKQIAELSKQSLQLCQNYQIPSPPVFSLALNMGGDDRTATACILQAPA